MSPLTTATIAVPVTDEEYYRSLGPWLREADAADALLTVEFAGGVRMCPAWQFTAEGQILPGLDQVLEALAPGFGAPASQAGWLMRPAYTDGDRPRWQYLADGDVIDLVVEWARQDARKVTAP